jgi:hypothetical protein
MEKFAIRFENRDVVEEGLSAIAKRARRKGIPGALAWSWGSIETRTEEHDGSPGGQRRYRVIFLALEGEAPRFEGWRFLATLQHERDGNIVRAVPGEEAPLWARSTPSKCDHCNSTRRRNDTYILAHDDGRTVQVGSSCIKDFLGCEDAWNLAAKAELVAEARELSERSYGSTGREEVEIDVYLAYVVWCVKNFGWVPRTRKEGAPKDLPTADMADQVIARGGYGFTTEALTDEIKAEARAAVEWTRNIPETSGDYLYNIRMVARLGFVEPRTRGLAASIVIAHQKAIGEARRREERAATPSRHVGVVGEKAAWGMTESPKKTARLDIDPLTLDFVADYPTQYGVTTVLKFRDVEGNIIVWKASGAAPERSDVGKKYALSGTIKAHIDYQGQAQTMVTRCKLTEKE